MSALIDGKKAPDPSKMDISETGGIPPDIDHFVYRHLPADSYEDIIDGKSKLQIGVHITYKPITSNTEFCNFTRFVYDYRTAVFRPAGGSDKCKGGEIF